MILFVVLFLATSMCLNSMVLSPFHDFLTLHVIYQLPIMKAEKFVLHYPYFFVILLLGDIIILLFLNCNYCSLLALKMPNLSSVGYLFDFE